MFFPYFLSWVVASYFVMAFLDPTSGMIPALQKSMGIKPTNFYHDTTYWPLILYPVQHVEEYRLFLRAVPRGHYRH